jgi:hypothetical protein
MDKGAHLCAVKSLFWINRKKTYVYIFFVVVPIIVGFLRFNKLNFTYRILLYSFFLDFFCQIFYLIFKHFPSWNISPFWNNIFNYLKAFCWYPAFVYVALSWSGIKKPALFAKVFSIVFIGAILMESYFIGLEEIRASLALSFCKALSLLIFIFTLNVILKQSTLKKTKRSRMLVIIPFLIGDIYGVSLDIFMYFLYSEETLSLFTNLFIALIYIGGLTLLSYALSIWWAPKKEVFI